MIYCLHFHIQPTIRLPFARVPQQMQHYDDAFQDCLEDVLSQKYMPRRQANPHLKKYYAGKRALPWRPSILSTHVSGYQDDLDQYRKYLWEQEKKSKLQQQRREHKRQDQADSDNEFPTRDKMTCTPKHQSRVIKNEPSNKTRKQNPRPALSHLMSALKATSKRQGWLQYYSYCCCFISDSPRISRERATKRSLPFMIEEGKEEAKYRPVPAEEDAVWMITRPTNPQSGRSRFHEGKEKTLQIHSKRVMQRRWGRHGGRGIRAWVKQAVQIQGIGEPRGDPTDWIEGYLIDLKNIVTRGPVFWVRHARFKRGKLVLDERAHGASLDPDSWGFDEADWDISSYGGSDIWLHEEWLCLSVVGEDGSEDEMALSWIEVDGTVEDDES
ncbi:hypothetical protein V8F06_006577 [Rhypophila decipiens]